MRVLLGNIVAAITVLSFGVGDLNLMNAVAADIHRETLSASPQESF
jgi:hypothetical protein